MLMVTKGINIYKRGYERRGGGPDGARRIFKTTLSYVAVAYFSPCRMLNLKEGYVACH